MLDLTLPYLATLIFLLFISTSLATSIPIHEKFFECMSIHSTPYTMTSKVLHTSSSSSYYNLLQSSVHNLRWLNSTIRNPLLIITPFYESEIQATVLCSKKHGLQIRVKSGGHDYEGLSYLSQSPFVIVDLINLKSISVDMEEETAWVESGATVGELYYSIAEKSRVHGFPAGLCPTVGVGGHFTGGGFGTMLRKYGLAADNIIDANLIDVNGRILNRKTMGRDLFWAIRGGGGASFGIIISWKVKLVRVPAKVTVFNVDKTIEQGATKLIHAWQNIAHKLHEDLFIRIIIQNVMVGEKKTIQASFNSLFLGKIDSLIPLMKENFPELGLQAENCTEMSWIESTLYFAGYNPEENPLEVLLDKTELYQASFKAKSDFVKEPIPQNGLKGIWEKFLEEGLVFMIMDPYGGRMNEILESELPFPHREGNLFNIQYLVKWEANGVGASNKHVHWIRMLYRYMKQYVSNTPRASYLNYRDLDLGINKHSNTSYFQARWGMKYFKGNFKKLASVKSMYDPDNFFRNEQSIPLLPFSFTYMKCTIHKPLKGKKKKKDFLLQPFSVKDYSTC